MCLCVSLHEVVYIVCNQMLVEDIRRPEAGVKGSRETSDVVLGTESWLSVRTIHALNQSPTSLALNGGFI